MFVSKHMMGITEAGTLKPVRGSRRGITFELVWEQEGCPCIVGFAAELHISTSPCGTSFLSQETCRNA